MKWELLGAEEILAWPSVCAFALTHYKREMSWLEVPFYRSLLSHLKFNSWHRDWKEKKLTKNEADGLIRCSRRSHDDLHQAQKQHYDVHCKLSSDALFHQVEAGYCCFKVWCFASQAAGQPFNLQNQEKTRLEGVRLIKKRDYYGILTKTQWAKWPLFDA